MIAIINYGLGNLGSIQNMLKKVGCTDAVVTADPNQINKADKLILPGVGAFDNGMQKINESGLLQLLNQNVLEARKPVLGICLGMQLLTRGSEEGVLPGLGWIRANTVKFNFGENPEQLKIPHMGWNEVTKSKTHPLTDSLPEHSRFYFVHSYYVKCDDTADELLRCHYGTDFTCSVQHENIMGVQFHPEKSHKFGMLILKNFFTL
jgi:imidazole glycerol-phosphate synthase subunit HisH